MIFYSSLGKLPYFSRPKIDWLYKFLLWTEYFCMHALSRPLVGWMYLRLCLLHWLDEDASGSFSFVLSLLRKVYRHYIPTSREFTRLRLLVFLWINLNENNMKIGNSQNYYVHNINIIHRQGICLEANAFREFDKYKYYKSTTSSIVHTT